MAEEWLQARFGIQISPLQLERTSQLVMGKIRAAITPGMSGWPDVIFQAGKPLCTISKFC